MKNVVVSFFLLSIFSNIAIQAQESFEVADIRVEGLSKISAETVFSYLSVGVGDEVNEEKTPHIIKSLFKTGFFRDIKLHQ